jgi:putrescine aminotransferase
MASKRETLALYQKHLAKFKASYYKKVGLDLVMGRRDGIYFWDIQGKKYINCHCNGGVFNLGHRNPEILAALTEGLSQYDIGNHHLISEPRAKLAAKLSASFGGQGIKNKLNRVIFGVSGGEAADLAIKLARGYTNRQKIISLSGGYHGHTGLALAAGEAKYREPFSIQLPGFVQVAFGDISALERELKGAAAVILETVPATLGMPVFPKAALQRIRTLCDRQGAALILDEIQTGLGRTGKAWGFQHYGIMPDIVITGKGFSGGFYPMAATCYQDKFERVFKKDPFIHISTFGGAEAGCAAALRVLEIVARPGFLKNVEERGEYFERSWHALRDQYPEIQEVRRLGMFMGVVFDSVETCLVVVRALLDNGIFAVYANNDKRVLQFLPPLVVTESESAQIMRIVHKSLADVRRFKYKLLKRIMGLLL